MPTIYELKEERVRRQGVALMAVFASHAASAEVSLELTEREAELLNQQQQGMAWVQARREWINKETEKAREEYYAAEEWYAREQAARVQEIYEAQFGAAQDLALDQLQQLASASEETLDAMLTLALQSSNDQGARAVLQAAWNRGFEQILMRWDEETENGEEDLAMLHELNDVEDEDLLRERAEGWKFDAVAPEAPTTSDLVRAGAPPNHWSGR
jgi:hypothetical protein